MLGALRDGKITLYPHVRVLNDIDYDLLEPVMTKNLGAIQSNKTAIVTGASGDIGLATVQTCLNRVIVLRLVLFK